MAVFAKDKNGKVVMMSPTPEYDDETLRRFSNAMLNLRRRQLIDFLSWMRDTGCEEAGATSFFKIITQVYEEDGWWLQPITESTIEEMVDRYLKETNS